MLYVLDQKEYITFTSIILPSAWEKFCYEIEMEGIQKLGLK